jgi:hypothetical protein
LSRGLSPNPETKARSKGKRERSSRRSQRARSKEPELVVEPPAAAEADAPPLPYPRHSLDNGDIPLLVPVDMPRPHTAPGASSTAPTQETEGKPRRISLTALGHIPKSKPKRRASEPSLREQKKKDREKVQYYYDAERGVMIRKGMYGEGYRPAEEGAKGTDLFKRIFEARIWGKVAGKVLW